MLVEQMIVLMEQVVRSMKQMISPDEVSRSWM